MDTIPTPLKLGSQTGSLINFVMSASRNATPEVGKGATIIMWSDRHACTISSVSKSGKTLKVIEDESIRVDKNGMSDQQDYEYRPGKGGEQVFTLRKNGAWVAAGCKSGPRLSIGFRDTYYDFSF